MSLSALGSQLAALSKAPGSGNVGSSLSQSKRHEDAIGRGLTHSVQVGYSVANKSATYKASIIYEDSRKASDVPLTTIRENCVASLRKLEETDPMFGSFVESLCNPNSPERALMTQKDNDKVDKAIDDLLFRLGLHMSSKSTTTSCLHVMEFLIRRYDIHARSKSATTALLALLSHHEQPYFLRMLQLIDLASVPTWTFLRPFAVPGARVARLEFSKNASKDTAFTRELCRLAQRHGKLQNSSSVSSAAVSKSLSFIAAVLVEAMNLQTRKTGTMHESTCQAILPFVATACKQSKRLVFQNWGHVVASAMVEHSVLAMEPRKLLVTSILHGAKDANVPEMNVMNCILVSLSILAQPVDGSGSPGAMESTMPVVGSAAGVWGFSMDKSIFQAFAEINSLATTLGHLFSVEGISEIADLVASLLVVAWRRLQQKKGDNEKQALSLRMISELTQESTLGSLWLENESELVKSYTAFLISSIGEDEDSCIQSLKEILKDLHRKDATAYDNGLAYALMRSKKERRLVIADLLGLKRIETTTPGSSENGITIPPRVALEHADAHVRLQAIAQLMEDCKDEDAMDLGGEPLHISLLRRFSSDDDSQVLLAAGDALCVLVKDLVETDCHAFGMAIEALRNAVMETSFESDVKSKVLMKSFAVASAYLPKNMAIEDSTSVNLVECLTVCMEEFSDIADVSRKAAESLLVVLKRGGKTSGKKNVVDDTRLALVSNEDLIQRIKSSKSTTISEESIRRRFLPAMLGTWSKCIERTLGSKKPTVRPDKLSSDAFDFCLWLLDLREGIMNTKEQSSLKMCLDIIAKTGSFQPKELPRCLQSLATMPKDLFRNVAGAFIDAVCKSVFYQNGQRVPKSSILLESAHGSSSQVIKNLMSLIVFDEHDNGVQSLVPLLALLSNMNGVIRKQAVELICAAEITIREYSGDGWSDLSAFSSYISANGSSAVLGGAAFLPKCFAAVVEASGNAKHLRSCIMKLCVCSAASCPLDECDSDQAFHRGWLPVGKASGGCSSASIILDAAELSSEESFPLVVRWKDAGSMILNGLLTCDSRDAHTAPILELTEVCVRMLKGVTVLDSAAINEEMPKVEASPVPGKGRRARSYSISKGDGLQFVHPYPKDMERALVDILVSDSKGDIASGARNFIFDSIFSSQSWGSGIFSKISPANRKEIEKLVLRCAVDNISENAADALFSLPLEAADVLSLMGDPRKNIDASSVSYLADYVSSNAQRISNSKKPAALFSGMFEMLGALSSTAIGNPEEADFARQSVMVALESLLEVLQVQITKLPGDTFKSWLELLGHLISSAEGSTPTLRPVDSFRQRTLVLSLLTSLAAASPEVSVGYLIPALLSDVSSAETRGDARLATDSFSAIIPLYCNFAANSDMTLGDLFREFVTSATRLSDISLRTKIYESFVKALDGTSSREKDGYSSIGSLAGVCLAIQIKAESSTSQTGDSSTDASLILQRAPGDLQLPSLITLIAYTKHFLNVVLDEEVSGEKIDFLPSEELQRLVLGGSQRKKLSKDHKNSLVAFCSETLSHLAQSLSSPSCQKTIRRQSQGDPGLSLRLWQDLLILQSACFNQTSGKDEKQSREILQWETMSESIRVSLEQLQSNLPTHMFLAFVTSLIKEGESEDLRSRAIRLLSERVALVAPGSHEVSLFVDLVPFLSELLREGTNDMLQQSALVAIESIGRMVCSDTDSLPDQYQDTFASVIDQCASSLSKSWISEDFSKFRPVDIHLLCSTAICSSTCIRVCGPKCLQSLPSLMKSFVHNLGVANDFLSDGSSMDEESTNQAQLLQLSVVRSLICVADKLPQFLVPYLNMIFQAKCFPSDALRRDDNDQSLNVKSATSRLKAVLSQNVAARQLIPAAAKGIKSATNVGGVLALLSLLSSSVKLSSSAEVSSQRGALVHAAMDSYDFDGQDHADELLDSTNDLVLALVLKLSEIQLRPLYTKLHVWRGAELDSEKPMSRITQRKAFWGLSSRLAKELKSIYLPCLTSVFEDAVNELVRIDGTNQLISHPVNNM